MKKHPAEAEMYHADGRTDRTELRVAFCNFANFPKSWCSPSDCGDSPLL